MSEMINYIKEILNHDKPIVWSWGAKNFIATTFKGMEALRFSVNGFIHKGEVAIAYNEGNDVFEVYCIDNEGKVVDSHDDVMFDELVGVIDRMVEKNTSQKRYNEQIGDWFSKL